MLNRKTFTTILIAMAAGVIALVGVGLASAQQGPSATRSFSPSPVAPGGTLTVTITASGYGLLGTVKETLPEGFTYVPNSDRQLDGQDGEFYLSSSGQTVTFTLIGGEPGFTYDVTASSTDGSYDFSGTLRAGGTTVDHPVGGDSTIMVGTGTPPTTTVTPTTPVPACTAPCVERSLSPARVAPGGLVTVDIEAEGVGFAIITETLPEGFEYRDAGLTGIDTSQVTHIGTQTVKFTLIDETSFTYTVAASSTLGSYTFSGAVKTAASATDLTVSGDSAVTVRRPVVRPRPAPATPAPAPAECVDAVSVGGSVMGAWADDDGCESSASGRGNARYYGFTLSGEQMVTISLESTDADTYLYLRSGNAQSGMALAENDDHEGSLTMSQISKTLAAGSYTIEATTYAPGETGSFTLSVSGTGAPPATDVCTQAVSGAMSGAWAEGCESSVTGRGHARYYTFTLAEERMVTINLESTDADPYLYLRSGDAKSGAAMHENDDHDGSLSESQISEMLAAGSYTIEATTYASGVTGSFTLTVSGLDAPAVGCAEAVSVGGSAMGSWAAGCESSVSGRGYTRYYTFTLNSEQTVTITLESVDADPYLYLRAGDAQSGMALHENDDYSGSLEKSQIREMLAAGSYTIEATTYDSGKTGSFTLSVAGSP